MSALEDWILLTWEETLVAEKEVAPEVARAAVAQLTTPAPNTERIAEIIKQAVSDGGLV